MSKIKYIEAQESEHAKQIDSICICEKYKLGRHDLINVATYSKIRGHKLTYKHLKAL